MEQLPQIVAQRNVAPVEALVFDWENAMQRDLLIIGAGMFAISLIGWSSWRDPGVVPSMHTVQTLDQDQSVKLVTERSPYMRSER